MNAKAHYSIPYKAINRSELPFKFNKKKQLEIDLGLVRLVEKPAGFG
jgi:hypothetical protein